MPTWNEVNEEIDLDGNASSADQVRHKYLRVLQEHTGRSVIAYYSGWLQKRDATGRPHPEAAITDLDMNAFMSVVHNLVRKDGLDLLLHTPGGGTEATRALVEYLYKMFGQDIRVIVPHMAMSAGTMIACASREIVLGKHSSLGPTDPQVRGHPAMGVLAEVDRAMVEIKKDAAKQFLYQNIFAKYPPAFVLDCERQVEGSREMVSRWLEENMLKDEPNPAEAAKSTVARLMDYEGTTEHSHHFMIDRCQDFGLKVVALEEDQDFQEHVLSVHHAFVASFARTNVIKFVENAQGQSWVVDS